MDLGCLDMGCIEKQVSKKSGNLDVDRNDSLPLNTKASASKVCINL